MGFQNVKDFTGGKKRRTKKHLSKKHKSKKHHSKRHLKRHNKKHRSRKTKRVQKGGFGPGACPFAGKPWHGGSGGNFFKLGTPIGVGGTPPFPGDVSPSPQTPFRSNYAAVGGTRKRRVQRGGKSSCNDSSGSSGGVASSAGSFIPSPILNGYRGTLGGMQNLWRQYQGLRPLPSPQPWSQHQQQI